MGTTTFSGPIKAGIIKHTTGSIVGEDIANTGFVEMSQVSAQLTQNALNTSAATTIIIPANSLIKGIHIFVTTVFAATNTVNVGWDYDNAGTGVVVEDALATNIAISAIGKTNITPTASAAIVKNWVNVGTLDKRIRITPVNAGAGECYVVVEYVQAANVVIPA
jgi:hypothetical protein